MMRLGSSGYRWFIGATLILGGCHLGGSDAPSELEPLAGTWTMVDGYLLRSVHVDPAEGTLTLEGTSSVGIVLYRIASVAASDTGLTLTMQVDADPGDVVWEVGVVGDHAKVRIEAHGGASRAVTPYAEAFGGLELFRDRGAADQVAAERRRMAALRSSLSW